MALGQEELGRLIAKAREGADMTQQELADAIGIKNAQSISRYERGETEVPTKRLRKIADATGKPLAFFMGETAPPEEQRVSSDSWTTDFADRMQRVEEREARNGEMLLELLSLVRGAQETPASEEEES